MQTTSIHKAGNGAIYNPNTKKSRIVSIYTFDLFWAEFHRINTISKHNKERCKKLFNECNFADRKKKAINEIVKSDSAYEYLTNKLMRP